MVFLRWKLRHFSLNWLKVNVTSLWHDELRHLELESHLISLLLKVLKVKTKSVFNFSPPFSFCRSSMWCFFVLFFKCFFLKFSSSLTCSPPRLVKLPHPLIDRWQIGVELPFLQPVIKAKGSLRQINLKYWSSLGREFRPWIAGFYEFKVVF